MESVIWFLRGIWSWVKKIYRGLASWLGKKPAPQPTPSPIPSPTATPTSAPVAPFSVEKLLLEGSHQTTHPDTSVLFYTIPKCASVFVWNMMVQVADEHGLTPVDFGGYCFQHGVDNQTIMRINTQGPDLFKPAGYLYGPFRDCLPVPRDWIRSPNSEDVGIWDLSRFRSVLMVRDPRDVLVSLYYSQAYSHPMPEHNEQLKSHLTKQREEVLQQGVDDFVLQWAPRFTARYRAYCRHLLNQPRALLLKYEDMVADFPAWLKRLETFLALTISASTRQSLTDKAQFNVAEDVMSHRRQVTPGDHIRKLQPATIHQLDEIFRDTLERLDYVVASTQP